MIELKFTPAQNQWLEVTWLEVTQLPDQIITLPQQEIAPGVADLAHRTQVIPGGIERKEVKHVSYHPTQWALLQADADAMGTPLDDHAGMLNAWVASYVPPAPEPLTFADFEAALDAHLDATAQTRQWTDRITCALRAGYPNPWQEEGKAFGTWMDSCNAMAYLYMQQVQDGIIPLPSTTQELIDALPPMVWPNPM
jgi:hypothetical protein